MGGLVIAEVALMPSPTGDRPLKHRIVGTVNFDVPFLGMHPGVVKSGLASIFSAPPEEPTDRWQDTKMGANADTSTSDNEPRENSPAPSSMSDGLWRQEKTDPNFNPSFQNDVALSSRKGWRNAWHFVSKHSDNLKEATKQLVTSHLEFGGAMANYGELKTRYARLRALEEDSDAVRKSVVEGGIPPRVRFVNYYTASTGRPKKPKTPQEDLPEGVGSSASLDVVENEMPGKSPSISRSPSPGIKSTENANDQQHAKESDTSSLDENYESAPEMSHVDPTPEEDVDEALPEDSAVASSVSPSSTAAPSTTASTTALSSTTSLPPIPDPPTAPAPLDVSFIEDKQTRKLVEKEHSRATKAYEQAVKERERIIRDRAKLEEKRERKEKKDASKAEKEAHKARLKAEKEDGKQVKKMEKAEEARELTHSEKEERRLAAERERMEREARRMRGEPEPEPEGNGGESSSSSKLEKQRSPPPETSQQPPTIASSSSPPPPSRQSSAAVDDAKEKKPPKDRKFCTLPPKDSQGQRDPCWPRVFMKDVDEVGAHCGLFFVDERYERLVGDVSERIEGWVKAEGGIEGGMERMRLKS